ncbi:MAG: hypothetical protein IT312_05915 [Anaerolineales bacterium]|nr:hypothetical protein [Anaerolineales bacterium]
MLILEWVAVGGIAAASVGMLIARDWRVSVSLLAAQYLAVFVLLLPHLPLGMASVKVVAGWMSCAILGITRSDLSEMQETEDLWPRGRLFRLFAAALVGIIVAGAVPSVDDAMADAGLPVTSGALCLVGMGLLHLGITSNTLRVTQGLMTVIAGFEILYATVEGSALVAALLAVITLGLALVGAYLTLASHSNSAENP